MDWYNFITSTIALLLGGGWFVTYKAHKREKEGEATQAEASGWQKQQEVYQTTIADLKETCDYIRKDRDLLRQENEQLRQENTQLRNKIQNLEDQMQDLKKDIARQGRRIETIVNKHKNKKNNDNTKEG